MQNRFIVLTMLVPIAAVCASSGASGQVPVPPAVAHFPAFQDSTVEMSLRNARQFLANVQRLLDDTTVLVAANRASDRAATLSAQLRDLDAQQAPQEERLQQTDAQLRTVFQHVER